MQDHGVSEHCSALWKAFRQQHSALPLTYAKKPCPKTAKWQIIDLVYQLCLVQRVTAQQSSRRLCCKVADTKGQTEMLPKKKHLTAYKRGRGEQGFIRLPAIMIGDHVLEVTNKCYLNTLLSGIIRNQKHFTSFSPWRVSPE